MFHVRCYRGQVHPDCFKSGLTGWLVVVLNFLRWQLERYISRLVVRFYASKEVTGKQELDNLRRVLDFKSKQEDIERIRTSPLFPASALPPPTVEEDSSISNRYATAPWSSGLNQAVGDTTRPIPIDDVIARYSVPTRQRRYATPVSVLEEEFEPVESGSNER